MGLTVLFPQPGSSADNLLELRHGANHFIQHNELCHFAVRPGGQQLGGGCNHRIGRGNGNKVVQLALSIGVSAGDSYNIVGILLNHVRIQIYQHLPHSVGCILRGTEDNGFRHAVCGFQVFGDLCGNLLNAVFDDNIIVIITVGIDPIFNGVSEFVQLPLVRPPPVSDIRPDVDYLKGC